MMTNAWIVAGIAIAGSILLAWATYEFVFKKRK